MQLNAAKKTQRNKRADAGSVPLSFDLFRS
jgi:hypothetical protein